MIIDIGDIHCYGIGMLISMAKEVYQYHNFKSNCQLTLQIFEIKVKYEEIVHLHLAFW